MNLMTDFVPDIPKEENTDDIVLSQVVNTEKGEENHPKLTQDHIANLVTDYIEGNNETIPIAPIIQVLQASASASSNKPRNWEDKLGEKQTRTNAELCSFVRGLRNETR